MGKKKSELNTQSATVRLSECEQFLMRLKSENLLMDDHGEIIIGRRERQLHLSESKTSCNS